MDTLVIIDDPQPPARYYVCDALGDVELCATEEEARGEASEALRWVRDNGAPDEDVERIEWGALVPVQRVERLTDDDAPDGRGTGATPEYVLRAPAEPDQVAELKARVAELEALLERVVDATRLRWEDCPRSGRGDHEDAVELVETLLRR